MQAVIKSQKMWIVVLLGVALGLAGLGAFAAFPSLVKGAPAPDKLITNLDPAIAVKSAVVKVSPQSCLITIQKEIEGPVEGMDGDRRVVREIEIIKVITACPRVVPADTFGPGSPPREQTFSDVSVSLRMIQCTKSEDLSEATCVTEFGGERSVPPTPEP